MSWAKRSAQRRRGRLFRFVTLLIVLAVVIFAISLFFKVENVVVVGNTKYYDADIVEISGIELGQRLYSFNKFKAIERIQASFAYASAVKIRRAIPSTVTITITESVPIAALWQDGVWWLMDSDTKLLERVDAARAAEYTAVTGLRLLDPMEAQRAQADETDALNLEQLKTLLTALREAGIYEKVNSIDVDIATDVSFRYEDRLTVRVGDCTGLDYQMRYFATILDELSDLDTGTIYFAEDKSAHFVEE